MTPATTSLDSRDLSKGRIPCSTLTYRERPVGPLFCGAASLIVLPCGLLLGSGHSPALLLLESLAPVFFLGFGGLCLASAYDWATICFPAAQQIRPAGSRTEPPFDGRDDATTGRLRPPSTEMGEIRASVCLASARGISFDLAEDRTEAFEGRLTRGLERGAHEYHHADLVVPVVGALLGAPCRRRIDLKAPAAHEEG